MKKTIILILVFLASLYSVHSVECGDTIGGSGNIEVILTENLECNTNAPALNVIATPNGHVTLDCNGSKIKNLDTKDINKIGIQMYTQESKIVPTTESITIKNCIIEDFYTGILVEPITPISGPMIQNCENCIIQKNSFINNYRGISLNQSSDSMSGSSRIVQITQNSFYGNGAEENDPISNLENPNLAPRGAGIFSQRGYLDIKQNCIVENKGQGILLNYVNSSYQSIKINKNLIDANYPPAPHAFSKEMQYCFMYNTNTPYPPYGNTGCNNNPTNIIDMTYNCWDYYSSGGPGYQHAVDREIEITSLFSSYNHPNPSVICCEQYIPINPSPLDTTSWGGVDEETNCRSGLTNTQSYYHQNIIPNWELKDGVDNDCDFSEDEVTCSDGIIEGSEECEGSNLNSQTCSTQGFLGGTLSCIPPGSQNECTFDTSNCYNCGVEGATCPNVNQQSTCCTTLQQSPGFTCRYYEFESISYPYAKKCCANDDETGRNCAQNAYTPQNGLFSITTCPANPTDIACCDNTQDCVYENKCYTDDGDYSRSDIVVNDEELTCTNKHWCPVGFIWDEDVPPIGACTPVENPCNGPLPSFCPYDILANTANYFLTSTCFAGITYTSQSCCYDYTIGIGITYDIYNWDGIKVYDTDGNVVSSPPGGGE